MTRLPFSIFKRKGRRFFCVQFKTPEGCYLPAISTKQTDEALAVETAFKWLRDGKPVSGDSGNNASCLISLSLINVMRTVKTAPEAEYVCRELKRQGLLQNYVIANSRQSIDFCDYLRNFWDYDSSPYIKEKLRKNHGIHKNYAADQKLSVKKYWLPFFRGRLLGDIGRQDIENFIDSLFQWDLSAGRKNTILRAGTIPLRWAFAKEIVEKDATNGIMWFSGKSAERQILTPETPISRRWAKRMTVIESLPDSIKKHILRTLDDVIKANTRATIFEEEG